MRGEELNSEVLWWGYVQGAFPMTVEDGSVEWFLPRERAVFPMETGVRVGRRFGRLLRRGGFEVTFDRNFEEVMRNCFRPDGNWLSEDFVRAYGEAHEEGWGHSCEVWQEGELVGGIYGLAVGRVFCAESMFHRRSDMSKVALWAMVARCRELGFACFDAQLMNPHLARMGAVGMGMPDYLRGLRGWVREGTAWSRVLARV